MRRMAWFLFAGGIGFLIDVGVNHLLLTYTPIGPFLSRIPAIMAAMSFTWFVNRNRTFDPSPHSLAVEGIRYWTVGITSALINYAIYSALIARAPIQPAVAIVFASAAATVYSFFGYSRFVFRHKNQG
ncbi:MULTISPECIES: GtrA family protein [Rhizobiaceae]|jgi:putative flippase GtrA|uniref:Putative flippase GtrA n=1 Tax=Aliirhizobium cellulosilyticum TaxID=393664 RepID=A0A7W6V003_9HYPH|nr:GtrA family protein [Rhizobium cellulosilyticum]MBB4348964.1 putative flippase GtrA [Rhizobium cellulosilyticum]MBB4412815.1 putative flippase GtrA [Rhizobium cellulosilyticum]MBB4447447.1 putative flippase GtrA [Rhizobium cellulosilyticum]